MFVYIDRRRYGDTWYDGPHAVCPTFLRRRLKSVQLPNCYQTTLILPRIPQLPHCPSACRVLPDLAKVHREEQ